jgi:hypothetical protein
MGFSFKPVRVASRRDNLFQVFLTLVQDMTFNEFQLLCQVRKLVVIPPATQPHPLLAVLKVPSPHPGRG